MKDTRGLPGYALIALAVPALVFGVAAAARGATYWAVGAGLAALLVAATGSVWIYIERTRVARRARYNALD